MPWAPRRAKPPHEPEYPNRQSAPPPSCTAADLYRQNLPLAPDGMHDRVGPLRLTRKSSAHRQKRYYREKSGLVQPLDIERLRLLGSGTANQSPRDFTLQWSDDGITWFDRKAFTGITWANNETKEFAIDGASPGAKSHWRIFVAANGGNTTSTVIRQVILPEWQLYQDFNHARRPAAWLKAPGMTGFDPCDVNPQLYDRPTNDYYNIAVSGCTGFVGAADFDNQPGALTSMALPVWNGPVPDWFAGNGQRVIVAAKVDTAYLSCYAGKMLPFGTPQQYPYPLLIGAPLPTASATRYSDSAVNLPYKGNRTTLKLRRSDGAWIQPLAWPYSKSTTFRDTNGAYPLLPITLYDTANTYGVLDGIHFITGFANAVENTVSIGAQTHVVLQDVIRNGLNDFFAMRIARWPTRPASSPPPPTS